MLAQLPSAQTQFLSPSLMIEEQEQVKLFVPAAVSSEHAAPVMLNVKAAR